MAEDRFDALLTTLLRVLTSIDRTIMVLHVAFVFAIALVIAIISLL
jgi:hypothetical protein